MRELLRRIRHLFQRRRFERDLAEEMAFHREMTTRELACGGVDPRAAGPAARQVFGSGALAQDQARDVWIWSWLQDLLRDCRFGVRLLSKDRRFTIVAAAVLGLGIGITNLQAVLINDICVRGLPVPNVDHVVFFAARDSQEREQPLSPREFDDLRSTMHGVSGLAAFATAPMVIGDEGQAPDRALGAYVSANAFDMLDERPLVGRDFESSDDKPGAPAVAILAHALWASRYGADPSIVGRTVRVNGAPAVIVGVMRDRFRFPTNTEIWQPLASMPDIAGAKRTTRALGVFGRLEDNASIGDVSGQLAASTRQMSHDYPDTNTGMRLAVEAINEKFNGRITDSVWLAFISVGVIVLLIACANTANLLLMRSATRGHEMALRASLGASRSQLVRQLLAESALLAVLGGAIGTALSAAGLRALSNMVPPNTLPYWVTFTMDRRVFALLCAICLGTVFVFGFAPALHTSRTDVGQLTKGGGGGGASVRVRRWTTAFLAAEFGLTMVMVAALLVSLRASRAAERAELVVNPANLVTSAITLSSERYRTPERRLAFYGQLEARLAQVPALAGAAVATALPFGGASAKHAAIEGQAPAPDQVEPTVWALTTSDRYFDVLSIPLLQGRAFAARDGLAGYESAIVNQQFARLFFSGANPIGRHIRLTETRAPDDAAPWLTIVGVSATVRQRPTPEPDPVVYLPLNAEPPVSARVIVRAPRAAAVVAPLLRDAVRAIDPDLPLYRTMSMEQALAESRWNGRVSAAILDGIVLVAICLAGVGVYTVTSYAVVQRTYEIGIRMALGAPRRHIVAIVLRRAAAQLGIGLLTGVACMRAWERLFGEGGSRTVFYHLTDPINLLCVAALLTLIAGIACVLPVRRAVALDPLVSVRRE